MLLKLKCLHSSDIFYTMPLKASNLVGLALVVVFTSASLQVDGTGVLEFLQTFFFIQSQSFCLFDAEPMGFTRFWPLRLLWGQKMARSFLAFSS